MPIYSIQTPDGRIVDIEAGSPETAQIHAKDWYAADMAHKQKTEDKETTGGEEANPIRAGLASALNTGLLHAPEALQAGIDYMRGESGANKKKFDTYAEYLDNVKKVDAAMARQNPNATVAGDVAGIAAPIAATVLTGGAAAPVAGEAIAGRAVAGAADAALAGRAAAAGAEAAAPAVADAAAAAAPSLAGQVVKNAGIGAAAGAADQGFQGNGLGAMADGALMGGALGGALPLALAGGAKAVGAAQDGLAAGRRMLAGPGELEALAPHGEQAEGIADGLRKMHADSKANYDAAYADMRNQPGYFHKDAFNGLKEKFRSALETFAPENASEAYGAARHVADRLEGKAVTLNDVDQMRQTIGNAAGMIDPSKRKAAALLKDAFDEHVNGITGADSGMFQGPQSALDKLAEARKLYADHAQFFNPRDKYDQAGKLLQKIVNGEDLSQAQLSDAIFGSNAQAVSSMGKSGALINRMKERIDLASPEGQQMMDSLRKGALAKVVGEGGYSDSRLGDRVKEFVTGRGKEAADALFTTTEKAKLLDAVKKGMVDKMVQGMVNAAANTGSLPFVGGIGHGITGGIAGLAAKTGAQMLKNRMAAGTQRNILDAVGALPPRQGPTPSIGLPHNPNMSLPVGVGYVGGQSGGLLQ